MPHLTVRGMKLEELKVIQEELLNGLSILLSTPVDHFTLEHENTIFISNESYPRVQVNWFKRTEELKQTTANLITDMIKRFNYEDVCVYFQDLDKSNYFENKNNF